MRCAAITLIHYECSTPLNSPAGIYLPSHLVQQNILRDFSIKNVYVPYEQVASSRASLFTSSELAGRARRIADLINQVRVFNSDNHVHVDDFSKFSFRIIACGLNGITSNSNSFDQTNYAFRSGSIEPVRFELLLKLSKVHQYNLQAQSQLFYKASLTPA